MLFYCHKGRLYQSLLPQIGWSNVPVFALAFSLCTIGNWVWKNRLRASTHHPCPSSCLNTHLHKHSKFIANFQHVCYEWSMQIWFHCLPVLLTHFCFTLSLFPFPRNTSKAVGVGYLPLSANRIQYLSKQRIWNSSWGILISIFHRTLNARFTLR